MARQTRRVRRSLCAKWLVAAAQTRSSARRWSFGARLGASDQGKKTLCGISRGVAHGGAFAGRMEAGMAARGNSRLD
jgi:hypothetical protein